MAKKIDWFKLHSLIEKEKKNGLKIVAAGLDHDGDSWTTVWIDYDGYVNTGKGCFVSEDDIPRVTFLYDKDNDDKSREFDCYVEIECITEDVLVVPRWWTNHIK